MRVKKGFSTIAVHAIIFVAVVIAATTFSIIVLSKIGELGSAISASAAQMSRETKCKIKIVYATLVYEANIGYFKVYVKNVGLEPIYNIRNFDVYLGTVGSAKLYIYNPTNTTAEGWDYVEKGNSNNIFDVGETLEISIFNQTSIEPPFYVKIVTAEGVSDTYIFNPPVS